MLCHICERFLSNVLHQDFHTWRRVEEGWFTFRLGNYATVKAAAEAGCEICVLFNQVRCERISNYADLSNKWHSQTASIDVKYDTGSSGSGSDNTDQHWTPRWSFQLLTVAPEMSWIPFELFHPNVQHDQAMTDEELDLGYARAVSDSPTSPETLEVARQWIRQCLDKHSDCEYPPSTPLPTRCIDVGTSPDNPTPRLQVNRGQRGRYVTLSHCWGVGNRLVLTKANIHEFKNAIPYSSLPKTFQDAIRLTILLGIRYIWIDALCIVQNDQADWRKESASMCSVFENAIFSISALAAADSHSGLLLERNIPHTLTTIDGVHVGVRTRLHSLPEALQYSRLETRAWCFQERLLARAILHVAPNQIYWECASRTISECQPQIDDTVEVLTATLKRTNTCESKKNSSWLDLVTEYSCRDVTESLDRLPAISGLAVRESHDDKVAKVYMQGLWSGDEHTGLMWRRQSLTHMKLIPSRDTYLSRKSGRYKERPKQQIASTWSWASINDAVEYPVANTFPIRLVAKSDAVFEPQSDTPKRNHPHAGMELRGVVKRGSCKPSTDASGTRDQATFRASGSLLTNEGVACFLDYDDDPVSRGCYCLRIANWTSTDSKAMRKRRESVSVACYLILEKTGNDGESEADQERASFKRIGMGFDTIAKVDKLFLNAEWRHLQLL